MTKCNKYTSYLDWRIPTCRSLRSGS